MLSTVIKDKIKMAMPDAEVQVETLDEVHFSVVVASEAFVGLSMLKQHKKVLDLFADELADNSIHALSVKTIVSDKSL